ncbi:MAG TPA: hypothetical protein VG347_00805 [Verrucomicrobiae bacterium]|nr:hypothetical protein [Verrucomicrobiae bacterium]
MRSDAQRVVMDFCLEHAESAPVQRRIFLYRGLAEICGDMHEQKQLRQMADDLEKANEHCREFRFNFSKPTQAAPQHDGHHKTNGGKV